VTGDVDGDGYADLLLFDDKLSSGHVYLVRGGPSGLVGAPDEVPGPGPMATFEGGAFGVFSSVTGDVDGDGFEDVLVASPFSNEVRLYRGSPGGLVPTAVLLSTPPDTEELGLFLARGAPPRKEGPLRRKMEQAGPRRAPSR
jgi:hypothetical protein